MLRLPSVAALACALGATAPLAAQPAPAPTAPTPPTAPTNEPPAEPAPGSDAPAPAPAPRPAASAPTPTPADSGGTPPAAASATTPAAPAAQATPGPEASPPAPPPPGASTTPAAPAAPAAPPAVAPSTAMVAPPGVRLAPASPFADEPPADADTDWPPRLGDSPSWGVNLDGVAGLAMPAKSDTQSAHAFVGMLLRARLSYLQVGGTYLVTDENEDQWKSIGGFVGAWLPFYRWVDVEAAAGVARRTYSSSDQRYGPGGFSVTSTAITLRTGVSARTSETWLGARIGGALVASLDVDRQTLPWTYEYGPATDRYVVEGTSPIGGFTFGMLVGIGLDVSPPTAVAAATD